MRIDSANRSFLALVAVALAPFLLVGLLGCGFLVVVAYGVATEGPSFVSAGLVPALLVLTLLGVGTVAALVSLRRQVAATKRLSARVAAHSSVPPADVLAAAERQRVRAPIDYLNDDDAFSFAYGLRRPRLAVSRGLAASLSPAELDAVLVHERYHLRNHDPLKIVIARVLATAFFFLPALRALRARYAAASEVAADRVAMRRCGRPAVAGALYRVVRGPAWPELATAAAIGGPELLDVRVAQLETGAKPAPMAMSRTEVLVTAVTLTVLAAVIVATLVMVGPTDMMPAGRMGM